MVPGIASTVKSPRVMVVPSNLPSVSPKSPFKMMTIPMRALTANEDNSEAKAHRVALSHLKGYSSIGSEVLAMLIS